MAQLKSNGAPDTDRVLAVLSKAKRLAREYYNLTGRPLGVTGEVAEYEAVRLLGLSFAPVRQAGYDASGTVVRKNERFQIKGRCIPGKLKAGARIGSIDLKKPWDAVLLVLLDHCFEATHIYRADRRAVTAALTAPGSKARNERGALAISKFKSIGRQVWARESM